MKSRRPRHFGTNGGQYVACSVKVTRDLYDHQ